MWKARDEAAEAEKSSEMKLKQAQEQAEQLASSAKTQALVEAYANHRALLQQLFPDVSVDRCGDDSGQQEQWLEEFEGKAQAILTHQREEVGDLVGGGAHQCSARHCLFVCFRMHL